MTRRTLYTISFVVFLLMFVTTFIVAIGGLIKLGLFAQMEPKYTDRLFYLLVVEIALIGVSMYKSIDLPRSNPILRYKIQLDYCRYAQELKDSLSDEQRKIWEQFGHGRPTRHLSRNEQAIIAEIKTAELNDGRHASGDVYLNFDSEKHWLEGSLNYKFPRDDFFTHMPVTGRMLDGRNMHLQVWQPERPFWDGDEIRMRPAANYSINLLRDTKDKTVLKGNVAYSPQQLNRAVDVANVVFIEIAN